MVNCSRLVFSSKRGDAYLDENTDLIRMNGEFSSYDFLKFAEALDKLTEEDEQNAV